MSLFSVGRIRATFISAYLEFLSNGSCVFVSVFRSVSQIRWVTTKGSFLTTAVFTNEDEMSSEQMSNDDKILTTAATLCRNNNSEQIRGKWMGWDGGRQQFGVWGIEERRVGVLDYLHCGLSDLTRSEVNTKRRRRCSCEEKRREEKR